MYYTIYKITNLVNGKYYIGKHQTNNLNDGYFGSGKRLIYAIKKYQKYNFKKEILHVFDNEQQMNEKEKELVVINEMSYNLCEGGKGGWSYINNNNIPKFKNKKHTFKTKLLLRKISLNQKPHVFTEEQRKKISIGVLKKFREDENYRNRNIEINRKRASLFHTNNKRKEKLSVKIKNIWNNRTEEEKNIISNKLKLAWKKRKEQTANVA